MKLFIATGVYPPESGGPATYSKLLEERLPLLNFPAAQGGGFEVRVLPFRTVRHLPKVVRHLAYFFACLKRAQSADAVLALDTVSVGLPAALAAKLLGKKLVVRVPGDYAWEQSRVRFGVTDELDAFQTKKYGWRTQALRRIQSFVVGHADAVIVPSDYMKRIVGGWTDARKVHRIYSSIEMPQVTPVQKPEGFLVVSSGRKVPWKHFDAIERVVGREPSWRFFLAENLPREEALGWVKAADVYVLNSTYEGLSHALVEAMALGTPVVATRVGGNPELIEDGVDGLLIPPKDDGALHAALKAVHDNPMLARARAERAKEKAKQFDIEVALDSVATLFKNVCAS